VPNIVGKSVNDAKILLDSLSLVLNIEKTQPSLDYQKDIIISQSISSGEQTKSSSVINVTISSGSAGMTLPNLVGLKINEAKKIISDLGIPYEIKFENSNDSPADTVINQSSAPNTPIDKGQVLVLTVSLGNKAEVTKIIKFTIPEGRVPTQVKVVALMDGEEKILMDEAHSDSKNREIKLSVTGSGTAHITIYLDDEIFAQKDIKLN